MNEIPPIGRFAVHRTVEAITHHAPVADWTLVWSDLDLEAEGVT